MCSTPAASRNSSPRRGKTRPQADALCRPSHRTAAAVDRTAHIGVHPQKQDGLNWIGVVLPVAQHDARRRCAALPTIAREFGDGDIRLTVWQNLLISGVADDKVAAARGRDRSARPDHESDLDPRAASSPAPAMSAAASPPPTPSATPRRSRAGARRASRSTGRSISISPAATIPARSTTSATSA